MALWQNASGPPADRFDPGPTPRADGFGKMGKKSKASMPARQKQGLPPLLKPHNGFNYRKMIVKTVHRNITPARENEHDRFRVKYNDKAAFDILEVVITRKLNGDQQVFRFKSEELPDSDSIHFSTVINANTLVVMWPDMNKGRQEDKKKEASKGKPGTEKKSAYRSFGLKTAFPPIANKDSKVLILGTMPGERSLFLQQYYGHAGNHFWKIMFTILGKAYSQNYQDRVRLLLDNSIALWDVLKHCESENSADSDIKNEIPNDFNVFYNDHPKVTDVFFSSKKAEAFYEKYIGKTDGRNYYILPSPSSANTWLSLDEKIIKWKEILAVIS